METEKGAVKKAGLASLGAVVLAFLASQHHTLHMLLFSLGMGSAGMSFLAIFPTIRRVMLLISLAMVGVIFYQVRDPRRPTAMRLLGGVSILLTLGLLIWSVIQFRI
jgi:1,4-dihydroxy-2-naphthoate octaprenyltransferase